MAQNCELFETVLISESDNIFRNNIIIMFWVMPRSCMISKLKEIAISLGTYLLLRAHTSPIEFGSEHPVKDDHGWCIRVTYSYVV